MNPTDISSLQYIAVVGERRFPVQSWQQVSAAYTNAIDALNLGASQAPQCIIKARNGRVVAHISYNGKVWRGGPECWQSGMKPIYLPGMEVCQS